MTIFAKYNSINVEQICFVRKQLVEHIYEQLSSKSVPSLENKFIKLHVSLVLVFLLILCVDMTNTYNLLVINNKQNLSFIEVCFLSAFADPCLQHANIHMQYSL